jgi:hypothetical protein
MADKVRIGGRTYGWASVSSEIDGVPFRQLVEWKWDEKLEQQLLYALGHHYSPVAKTPGKYVPDPLTYNIWLHSEQAFNAILLAANEQQGNSGSVTVSKPDVTISIAFYEPALGTVLIEAIGCNLIARGGNMREGTEGPIVTKQFQVMRYVVTVNDQVTTLWDSDETGPY